MSDFNKRNASVSRHKRFRKMRPNKTQTERYKRNQSIAFSEVNQIREHIFQDVFDFYMLQIEKGDLEQGRLLLKSFVLNDTNGPIAAFAPSIVTPEVLPPVPNKRSSFWRHWKDKMLGMSFPLLYRYQVLLSSHLMRLMIRSRTFNIEACEYSDAFPNAFPQVLGSPQQGKSRLVHILTHEVLHPKQSASELSFFSQLEEQEQDAWQREIGSLLGDSDPVDLLRTLRSLTNKIRSRTQVAIKTIPTQNTLEVATEAGATESVTDFSPSSLDYVIPDSNDSAVNPRWLDEAIQDFTTEIDQQTAALKQQKEQTSWPERPDRIDKESRTENEGLDPSATECQENGLQMTDGHTNTPGQTTARVFVRIGDLTIDDGENGKKVTFQQQEKFQFECIEQLRELLNNVSTTGVIADSLGHAISIEEGGDRELLGMLASNVQIATCNDMQLKIRTKKASKKTASQ